MYELKSPEVSHLPLHVEQLTNPSPPIDLSIATLVCIFLDSEPWLGKSKKPQQSTVESKGQ